MWWKKKNELKKKNEWKYDCHPIGIVLDWQSLPAFLEINEDDMPISTTSLNQIQATVFRLRVRIETLCSGSLLNRWRMTDPRRRSREWFKRYDEVIVGFWHYKKAFSVLNGANLITHVVLAHLNKDQEHQMTEMLDEIDALVVMLNLEKTL